MHLNKRRIHGGPAIAKASWVIAKASWVIAKVSWAIAGSIYLTAKASWAITPALALLVGSAIATWGCASSRSAEGQLAAPPALAAAAAGGLSGSESATHASSQVAAEASEWLDIAQLEPSIRVEIRYATPHNFTGKVVYPPSARCYLRAAVARRLQAVQQALLAEQRSLKVYDCYRPLTVQRHFFALVPDERYVANPQKGSRHNRGAAVDLTLTDLAGVELVMPTEYDDFSERAHRSYMNLPPLALANRERLAAAMAAQGFVPLPTEWWHFDDREARGYPLSDISFDELAAQRAR